MGEESFAERKQETNERNKIRKEELKKEFKRTVEREMAISATE